MPTVRELIQFAGAVALAGVAFAFAATLACAGIQTVQHFADVHAPAPASVPVCAEVAP